MGTDAKDAFSALVKALKDEDVFVRRFSAMALGATGSAEHARRWSTSTSPTTMTQLGGRSRQTRSYASITPAVCSACVPDPTPR